MCGWRVYHPVSVIYDAFNIPFKIEKKKKKAVEFYFPSLVYLSFPRMNGSVWAEPVGQMCDRCRPYRSAARGRFTLVVYSLILWRVCARECGGE